ncbi:MAG: ABC transporter permease subunit, partial [Cyanobacteria bacterium P01_D01_bin.56]
MLNLARIAVVARNVFLEVIRDRILYLAGLFAVLMVLAAVMLPQVAAGTNNKILLDLGLAAINVFTLVVVIFVGTGLVNKEIEKKTVLVLIAKPVSRFEIILGK